MKELSEKNGFYAEFIKDIFAVSSECGVKTYIWGGFAADILEGAFLREHSDLDGFTENMLEALDKLTRCYQKRGYETEFRTAYNILIIKKNGLHAAFNALDISEGVAMWRHIGDRGTVYFPSSWLVQKPLDFCGAKAYVSGARFEFAFRTNAHRLNPKWKMREKDAEAIGYYEKKINEKGFDTKETLRHFWSYNPFWIEFGYDAFKEPVLVCPLNAD